MQNGIEIDVIDRIERLLLWVLKGIIVLFILVLLHFTRRVFIADRFIIPSDSMEPTFVEGDKIWVNKLLFGARIYTSFDFSSGAKLKSFRMPALRKISANDIICFNIPRGSNSYSSISFQINYVGCKRVMGCPGDEVQIYKGIAYNNSTRDSWIGNIVQQARLVSTKDEYLIEEGIFAAYPLSLPRWTIKEMGPLYVPKKGETIELDDFTRVVYAPIIEFETGSWPYSWLTHYTFKQDYYYLIGDNVLNSNDSRYWGFVPADFIIGVVTRKSLLRF